MFSWIGASVMCWKGTDPLRLSLDFYLINYKKGLELEEKLEALTKLTALAEIKANNNDIMGKISVAVHGGYSADALSDNQSMFNNKGYVRSQRLANPNNNQIIGFMNGLLDGADKLGNNSGLVRIPQEGAPRGVITVQIGKKVAITEFSKYLKLFAFEVENWDGRRETKPRTFLQNVGSLIRHELFSEDFLIDRLLEDMKVYEKLVDVLIIADARFPKEINKIKNESNATSIRIINSFNDYELKGNENKHETENSLEGYDKFDFVINNETFEQLENDMINIVKKVEENE